MPKTRTRVRMRVLPVVFYRGPFPPRIGGRGDSGTSHASVGHDVGVDAAARIDRLRDAMTVVARNDNGIATTVDTTDDPDMTAAAASTHDGDCANPRAGDPSPVMRERTRHVGARSLMPGAFQNHVHEAGAPEPAAAGRIAADIATGFGDDIRNETARETALVSIPVRGVAVSVMVMAMPVMPAGVMMMMLVMMNVRVMARTMMRSCRGRRRKCDNSQRTNRQCQDTRQPAQRN